MSLFTKKWAIIIKFKKLLYHIAYGKRLEMSDTVTFRNGFHVFIEDTGFVRIGENTFFNNYCSVNAMNSVIIGENCLFGENVKIYDHNHKFRDGIKPIAEQGFSIGSVTIGDNCWIGTNVVILKNSCIGEHCVIAAGTVVDGEVPSNTIIYRDDSKKRMDVK